MSLDELREDLKRNISEAKTITSIEDVRSHLVNTLWPFQEAVIDVVEEIDDAVAELVDQQEDYLQPETAGVFAAVIQSGLGLAEELKKRAGTDLAIVKAINAHQQLCEHAATLLGDITMIPSEDDSEDGDTSDGSDDDDADADAKESGNE